jgi:hypothetical protein
VTGNVGEEGAPAARGRPSGPRALCPRCLRRAPRTCLPRAPTPRACANQRQVLAAVKRRATVGLLKRAALGRAQCLLCVLDRLQQAAGGGQAAARAPLHTKCTLIPKQVPENVTHGAGGGMRLGSSRLSAKRSTRGCASASMAACGPTHSASLNTGGQPSMLITMKAQCLRAMCARSAIGTSSVWQTCKHHH